MENRDDRTRSLEQVAAFCSGVDTLSEPVLVTDCRTL